MPQFGVRSQERIATLDERLQLICFDVIQWVDFTVICGHRSQEAQEEAFATGMSTVHWPGSKHNHDPSAAVDVAPWPIDWDDHNAFSFLAGMLSRAAIARDFRLRWGGDWDSDGGTRDQRFMDLGHLEIAQD